jgi:uncharacterized BrkB/YihY/UPF0761 family membrane protein
VGDRVDQQSRVPVPAPQSESTAQSTAERASSFGSTYGPLTGVVALLPWSLLSSRALFFGIAFSAQLEACRTLKGEPVKNDPGA